MPKFNYCARARMKKRKPGVNWCDLCSTRVDFRNKKCLSTHVNGKRHRRNQKFKVKSLKKDESKKDNVAVNDNILEYVKHKSIDEAILEETKNASEKEMLLKIQEESLTEFNEKYLYESLDAQFTQTENNLQLSYNNNVKIV